LSDAKDAPEYSTVRDLDFSGCELFEGDVSLQRFHPLVHSATHIYAFDVVFSRSTHAKILPIVEASNFKLFGCYLSPSKLQQFGCKNFTFLTSISVRTTGKQCFTCFFYQKKTTDEADSASAATASVATNASSAAAATASSSSSCITTASPATASSSSSSSDSPPDSDPKLDPTRDEFYQNIRDLAPPMPEHLTEQQHQEDEDDEEEGEGDDAEASVSHSSSPTRKRSKKKRKSPSYSSDDDSAALSTLLLHSPRPLSSSSTRPSYGCLCSTHFFFFLSASLLWTMIACWPSFSCCASVVGYHQIHRYTQSRNFEQYFHISVE